MRHSDVYRDLPPSDLDRVAFDGDEIVGRVLQHQHGQEHGQWIWSITAIRPEVAEIANWTLETRGEALRRVVEAYKRLLPRKGRSFVVCGGSRTRSKESANPVPADRPWVRFDFPSPCDTSRAGADVPPAPFLVAGSSRIRNAPRSASAGQNDGAICAGHPRSENCRCVSQLLPLPCDPKPLCLVIVPWASLSLFAALLGLAPILRRTVL
jgi:hypothetical protein